MANFLNVPSGSGASTPDQAGLAALATSIDLRIEIAPTAWATGSTYQALIDQYVAGAASGTRFWSALRPDGTIEYDFYNNTPATTGAGSIATGLGAGTSKGIRVLHNITAGTVDFYTSPDFTVWTPLGSQVTGLLTVTQSVAGTAPIVRIGTDADGNNFAGKITKVQVLINAVTILNMNWTTATLGNGPWTATSGETWTRIGTSDVQLAPAVNTHGSFLLLGVG